MDIYTSEKADRSTREMEKEGKLYYQVEEKGKFTLSEIAQRYKKVNE